MHALELSATIKTLYDVIPLKLIVLVGRSGSRSHGGNSGGSCK